MHEIYLTDEQSAKIAQLADDRHASKAEVIRRILDEALGIRDDDDDVAERAVIEATAGLCGTIRIGRRQQVPALFSYLRKPVTDVIARGAGRYLRQYRRSHQSIDLVDYVIAATAEHFQAELLALNVKHFPMLDQLDPPW